MKKEFLLLLVIVAQIDLSWAQSPTTISKGELKGPLTWTSKIYPGTERNYWVYVPAQYDAAKPACVMIVQDGLGRAKEWNLPTVMDSLIALKEMPVTLGIFIDHGKVASVGEDVWPRFNRSFEYDAMGDRYARFLLEEILPEVSKSYNLSSDPSDRSLAGASSGAICAFNAAWERPDAFRRVLSTIGTYVGLRGGDTFATLVRKSEPKPLRIFLEDGDHDLNIYAGDWWMSNQDMLSALMWAGYEVDHAWGTEGHNGKHGRAILPEALKFLWKDYPKPVQSHKGSSPRLNPTAENEPWREVKIKDLTINKLTVNKAGEVFFTAGKSVYKVDDNGNTVEYAKLKGEAGGLSFDAEGKLYAGDLTQHKIVVLNEKGMASDVITNVNPDFMTISRKGIYFSETSSDRIGFYGFSKKSVQYISVAGNPTGLGISAEQTFLNVGIATGVFGYSLKIADDGALTFGQEYTHYHVPYGAATPGTKGMTVDSENILYSATAMGIQASDQLGRVNFIFSNPGESMLDVKFGGKDFSALYVNCKGKLFARKINARGVLPFLAAVKPPPPRM